MPSSSKRQSIMSKHQNQSLKDDISKVVAATVAKDSVNADPSSVAPITAAVVAEVAPQLQHLAGQTPWYQSQVFWGLVVLILTRILARWGESIPEEMHGPLLDFLVAYGPYF